ncbi:MAG: YtxH domain-containing protein [Chitinophagales bacterium]|nr:YtxH domain-containing protein [Chitinophagales bacterium]
MKKNSKGMMILLFGVAIGIGIGYVLAIDNKEELIDDFRNSANKIKGDVEDEIVKGKRFISNLKNKVSSLMGDD